MDRMKKHRMSDKMIEYICDYNGVGNNTGFTKNATITPPVAHAISCKQVYRCGVTNYVCVDLPCGLPVEEYIKIYEKHIKGKDDP